MVCAFALATVPTFAANTTTASSTMVINLADYINITTTTASLTSTATPTDDYVSLTLSPALAATFKVVTNKYGDHVYLRGTTLADGNTVNALCAGAEGKLRLVFGKQAAVATAAFNTTTAAVQNITNGTAVAVASNPNAIAFDITPSYTHTGAATADPSPDDISAGVVTYDIDNGEYTLTYTLDTAPSTATFSTHDTSGTYQAILTMNHVAP